MKIIITVNTYYPLKDGVQMVTEYHAENLAKQGHEVIVFTPNYGHKNEEVYNGVKIYRVDAKTKHAFYFGDKKNYIDRILKESKNASALINVCTQNPMTDWCLNILNKIECKKILYMHGMHDLRWNKKMMTGIKDFAHKIWNNVRWGIYYALLKKYLILYDDIIQLHKFDYGYEYFLKKYDLKCKIIENAAENVFFENKIINLKSKYAVCVANYIPRKNQEFILKAFYKANIDKNFGLILIGSDNGEYYRKLIQINNKLKLKYGKRNVQILDNVSREETIKFIKNARVYLMGSKWEAFPISIVEAMAAGIPFISTDVGCVKYMPGGIIINNEDEMAYWLEIFSENSAIRDYYGRIGNTYAIEHMSIEKKVNELEKILEGKE